MTDRAGKGTSVRRCLKGFVAVGAAVVVTVLPLAGPHTRFCGGLINGPISVYRLGEMPIQSCGQSVSSLRGKAGAWLNAHTELRAKRQRLARKAIIGLLNTCSEILNLSTSARPPPATRRRRPRRYRAAADSSRSGRPGPVGSPRCTPARAPRLLPGTSDTHPILGPSRHCSPRHKILFHSCNEGSICVR